MLIKLAALGALGFAGYSYLRKHGASAAPAPDARDVRLAGGPLSSAATVQHNPDRPPPPPG